MSEPADGRFDLKGRTLREHAARGAMINAAFLVALSLLGFVKGFVLAGLLSPRDYGVWGALSISLGMLIWLKQAGVRDRYIRQDDTDQERAFQEAFTFELLVTGALVAVLLVALPGFCLLYGEWELLAPGLVMILGAVPAMAFASPLWVYYRRMEFLRQRTLEAIEPIVGFVVAVGLAVAGFGYWAFVLGMLAGIWALALVVLRHAPYPLRLRVDRGSLGSYWSFSWPLLVTSGSTILIAQSAVVASELHLGLAAVGAVALAANISALTNRVDVLVTGTLYPAVAAVRDRIDVLHESFVKSNRLALLWAMPFGIALTLFAADLVRFAIGEKWEPAVGLLQVYGAVAAVGHVAFNWDAYVKAIGDTRPMAVASVAAMVAFLGAGIPLLLVYDLDGLAAGVAIQSAVHVACRVYFLRRIFDGYRYLRLAGRAMLPTVPAAGAVLVMRAAAGGERTAGAALAELVVFLLVAAAASYAVERALLREAAGYLRRARA